MKLIESICNNGHGTCNPSMLAVHSTANPGASAYNHYLLYSRGYKYAVQYVGDWTGNVYHCMFDNRLAWGVGNGNRYCVNLEICEGTTQEQFDKTWNMAVEFCAWYLKYRGWSVSNLISHNEARIRWGGTDHTDPNPYFNKWGKTWAQFVEAVKYEMGFTQAPVQGASKLNVDGYPGTETVKRWQKVMKLKGYDIEVDGIVSGQYPSDMSAVGLSWLSNVWKTNSRTGSMLIRAWQDFLNKQIKAGLNVDGFFGTKTCKATQRYFETLQDGYWSKPSSNVMALQTWLNTYEV